MVSFPSINDLNSSARLNNDVLHILKFSLHSSSIILPLAKLSHHALVLPGRVQNRLRRCFPPFLTLWSPVLIESNFNTLCLCRTYFFVIYHSCIYLNA